VVFATRKREVAKASKDRKGAKEGPEEMQPFRVGSAFFIPQGSSFLATLGFADGIPLGFNEFTSRVVEPPGISRFEESPSKEV